MDLHFPGKPVTVSELNKAIKEAENSGTMSRVEFKKQMKRWEKTRLKKEVLA